ncbi:hypothetical protein DE146DRAFT_500747 [Phaeosphaeria sp. MPI-PUGE-AT-0046c]|nr:hypothetical protein DE146DRAFT_500747 [Phaeosphaeria sp. MPI-PUGE-AT-0046c]
MATTNLGFAFRTVTLIFASAALFTGLQAVLVPAKFASSFGISLPSTTTTKPKSGAASATPSPEDPRACAYVSLMGARQLGTGMILSVFAYQGKWAEAATILSIIGVVVAGTDGWYIAKTGGSVGGGLFHAGPGAAIAALAAAFLWTEA